MRARSRRFSSHLVASDAPPSSPSAELVERQASILAKLPPPPPGGDFKSILKSTLAKRTMDRMDLLPLLPLRLLLLLLVLA